MSTDIRLDDFQPRKGGLASDGPYNDEAFAKAIAAVPDKGGCLRISRGTYCITKRIPLKNSLMIDGEMANGVNIRQLSTTEHMMQGTDILDLVVQNLTLQGPGSGSGHGLYFAQDKRSCNYVTLRNLKILNAGQDGVRFDHVVVSEIDKVVSNSCGGNGFTVLRGTSVHVSSTFSVSCAKAGYHFEKQAYCNFSATAADNGDTGYEFISCQGFVLNATGFEENKNLGMLIDRSESFTINSPYNWRNLNKSIHVTGGSKNIIINNFLEDMPNEATAQSSLEVDDGCNVVLNHESVKSPLILAPRSTIFPDAVVSSIKNSKTTRKNATLASDPNLITRLGRVGSVWTFHASLFYSSPLGVDLRLAFQGPDGTVFNWAVQTPQGSILTSSGLGDQGSLVLGGSTNPGAKLAAFIRGVVKVGSTPGDLVLRWAQGHSNLNAETILFDYSFMELRRI